MPKMALLLQQEQWAPALTLSHLQTAMSQWRSVKASRLLAALLKIGWSIKRQNSSHKTLERPGYPNYVFAFHDKDEIGPKMLARVAKHTGLTPDDL
jgi:predicted RNA binding protein YcfA (HicA-like mRNA interferase family)